MTGDGDGWVQCALGHRHWGRFGAAGLLLGDDHRVVLQHRAPWTHEGGTWGLPGGARDSHEDPVQAALREAREEAAIAARSVAPVGYRVEDHGGWSYTTVVATPTALISPHAANAESTEVRWWAQERIAGLPLHHGFAASWPRLRQRPGPLLLIVADVAPHDEAAVRAGLDGLARVGVRVDDLPPGVTAAGLSSLLPRIRVTGDLAPTGPRASSWFRSSIQVVSDLFASTDAADSRRADVQTVVISSQAHLATPTTQPVGPGWLLAVIDAAENP